MSALRRVALDLGRSGRKPMFAAAFLAALVPLTGMLLVGLSGWFVAASAVAGLAGLGLVFDFFRPSSVIRLSTFARAAARYGERLIGHDATLRALVLMRVNLFARLADLDLGRLLRLRSMRGLNQLTADLDAVEGLLIRLVFPAIAMAGAWLAAAIALAVLIDVRTALVVAGLYLLAALMMVRQMPLLSRAARRQEAALQAIRARSAEAYILRADATLQSALGQAQAVVLTASARLEAARGVLDAAERVASVTLTLVPALALVAVLLLAQAGAARTLAAALLAYSLGDPLRVLWRGLAESGRMALGARRLAGAARCERVVAHVPPDDPVSPLLVLDAVELTRPGSVELLPLAPLSLRLCAGEWITLLAPSGAGKSTLLMTLAGLLPLGGGHARLAGAPISDWPESALRLCVALVPQRPVLLAGSIAENLALAAPEATPAAMEAALQAVALWPALLARGGLQCTLGARGAGLSGGEARRLALARALLRRPRLLLLDEPTEGLDAQTAAAVLDGIGRLLPTTAVIMASHRATDLRGRALQLIPAAYGPDAA